MTNFIIGFFVCYCLFSLFAFIDEEYDGDFVRYLIKPWCVLGIIVCYVPCFVWKLFRCLVKGITQEVVDKTATLDNQKTYHLFGNVYLHHDKNARLLVNRWFFYRIKKEE